MTDKIGTILSAGTTTNVKFQLNEKFEHEITEGKLVEIKSGGDSILAMVSTIQPHNDFYMEGGGWSESLRKGMAIPSDVARQYVSADLEILGTLPGLVAINRPPLPSDSVYNIDVSDPKKIFGFDQSRIGYVWYGTLKGYDNAPVPLSIEECVMHMAIFGTTGSGKSYSTGALIEKLVNVPVDKNTRGAIPMIIIDSNGDYYNYPENLDKFPNACGEMIRYVFPNSPALGSNSTIRELRIDLGTLTRSQLAETIMQFYAGTKDLEELQVSGLEQLLEEVEEKNLPGGLGNPQETPFNPQYNHLFSNDAVYNDFINTMDNFGQTGRIHRGTVGAIRRAMDKFRHEAVETGLFGENPTVSRDFLDDLTNTHSTAIFDFSAEGAPGISLELKQVIVGIFATMLYQTFTEYKTSRTFRSIIFAIEEAHNFIPNQATYKIGASLARKMLHLIATQGRKFGIGLCLISQRPAFLDEVVLSMVNTFFIHKVAIGDLPFVKKVTGVLNPALENQLSKLPKGELIITGMMSKDLPIPIRIQIRKDIDRKVSHPMGTTNVVESLKVSNNSSN